MGMGGLSQQPPLVPHTAVSDGSVSLLPTFCGVGLQERGLSFGSSPAFPDVGASGLRPLKLLPTATASQPGGTAEQHLERKRGGKMLRRNPTVTDLGMVMAGLGQSWGEYEPAIRRWETVMGWPHPTALDRKKITPAFVEWMMGLPAGACH